MNPKKEIILGFTEELNSTNINEDEFPSKLGGQPIWLNKTQIPKEIKCEICGQIMKFLLQLYSPLSNQAHYRCLYVFQCTTTKCQNSSQQIKVIRQQLNQSQKISNFKEIGTYPLIFENEYVIVPDQETKKEAKQILLKAEELINSLNVPDQELQLFKDAKKEDFEKEMKLASQYMQGLHKEQEEFENKQNKSRKGSVASSVGGDSDEEGDPHKDAAYTKYEMFMNELGQHCIRFCRDNNTLPLWYGDKNQWKPKQAGKCQYCGSKRIFEFQLNNSILNLFTELISQDWGIGVVYTCEKSCDVKDQQDVYEHIVLQTGTEDPLTQQEIEKKLAEMQLEDEDYEKIEEFRQNCMKGKNNQENQEQINEDQQQIQQQQQQQQKQGEDEWQTQQKPKKNKNKKNKKQKEEEQKKEENNQEEEEDDW